MTMEEYVKTLAEMDDCIRMPKEKLAKYADATYTRNALLIKPSLYYTLFRRPWHFLCNPFNKLLNWIGDHMPLYDITGQPMDDRYIHLKVMLKMAGFVPMQDFGWHVVDACPPCNMDAEGFKKYFRSQCRAAGRMPRDRAEEFFDALYSDYVEKNHIYEFGKYHRFTSKMREKILNVIAKAEPSKSFLQLGEPGSMQKFRANFNIDSTHYLYIEANTLSNMPQGAPSTIVKVSWTKKNDDNDVVKHQIWYDGDQLGWLMRHIETLAPVYQKALDEKLDKAIEKYETLNKEGDRER